MTPTVTTLNCAYDGNLAGMEKWVEDTFTFPERLPLRVDLHQALAADAGVTVKASFLGTYTQFHHWVRETFKHPDRLNVKVQIGVAAELPEPAQPPPAVLPARTLDDLVKQGTIDKLTRDNIMQLLRRGQKIEAIKAYRAMTSVGLKEAKDAVEKYWYALDLDREARLAEIL